MLCALSLGLLLQSPGADAPLARGVERVALLPLEPRGGLNGAHMSFPLDTAIGGTVTLRVFALDFEPGLQLRKAGGGEILGTGRGAVWSDAWLTTEIAQGAGLEVEIVSLDDRGGEFTLDVQDGIVRPPTGTALLGARRERCEAAGRRADSRHDDAHAVQFWQAAGAIAHSLGDCADANESLRRCLELAGALGLHDVEREARLRLALCLDGDAERLVALQALEPAIESAAAAARGQPGWVTCAKHLALLHDGLGDAKSHLLGVPAAAAEYRKAAEALEGTGSASQRAIAFSKLSAALELSGATAEADRTLEQLDSLALEPAAPLVRAVALFSRSRVEALRGASAEARRHALAALEQAPPPGLRAEILGTLANACLDLALYEEASARLDELAGLVQAPGVQQLELPLRRARAVLALRLRDVPRARAELQAALDGCSRSADGESWIEAAIDLAVVLEAQGQRPAAAALLEQAIERARDSGQSNLLGRAWLDRGFLYEHDRDLEHAEDAYRRCAEAAASSSDERLAALAECGFGTLAHLRGRGRAAREHAGRAAQRLEELGFTEEALDARDVLARQALVDMDAPALAAEIARASELLQRFERQKLDVLLRAAHRSRFAEWSACEQSLVDLELVALQPGSPAESEAVQRGFESASRWKGQSLLAELSRGLESQLSPEPLAPAERGAWLHADTALLEYSASLERLVVYLVLPARIERIDLGDRLALADEAQRLSERMADRYADGPQLLDAAASLWRQLMAPVASRLPPSVHTLVIVPAPEVATVPFEALVSDARPGHSPLPGEPRCLIDDYLVCYAPASALLPVLRERPERGAPQRSLIVSDAICPQQDARCPPLAEARADADPELDGLRRLEYSRGEALDLVGLLIDSQPGERSEQAEALGALAMGFDEPLHGRCFDLYLGARARPDVLWGDLREYSDLHLALHARVDPGDPRRSGLVLSVEQGGPRLFTLEHAWNARLDADLVVLSACSSARGPVLAGEGVQSLAYAFLHAGSRAVVATLWNVDDRDAAEILRDLEAGRHSASGLHPAQALRAARQAYRLRAVERGGPVALGRPRWNPWTWAPYVYIGAPPR
jgi:CHAT domain-containing protein